MKYIKYFLITIFCFILCGCKEKNINELNVLNWTSYIPYEVIDKFEKEYNIKVNYNTYSSNEELLAKTSNSKIGTYDLIFPSDYMVELMIEKDLLEKIDKNKLTNIDNINELFLNQEYDYNNEYSLPFLAASTVIAVNRENITDNIDTYNDLLNSKYKNDIVILDDQRIVIGMGLLALGYDMNDVDDNHLKESEEWLLKLKKNVKSFNSDSPKTLLMTDEVNIGVIWNAEAQIAKDYNDNIEIIYPKDGVSISVDNYAIVKGSKNIDNAYKFIDYLLRNDVNSEITKEYPYISTNFKVRNITNTKIKYILSNSTYVKNIGDNLEKYNRVWANIK